MEPNVDNLNIQLSADASDAEKSLIKLSDTLQQVGKTLRGIYSPSLQDLEKDSDAFTKSLNQINAPFKQFRKSTQAIEDSIEGLRKLFKDAGKDFVFTGDSRQLEKSISQVEKRLDKLFDREDRLKNIGANVNTQAFRALEFDISKATNQLDILRNKYSEFQKASSKRIAEIPIYRGDDLETGATDKQRETITSAASLNYDPAAMEAVFGNVAEKIKNWRDAVNQFGNAAGMTLNKVTTNAEKAEDALSDQDSASGTWKKLWQYVNQVNSRLLTVKEGMSELPKIGKQIQKSFSGVAKLFQNISRNLKGLFSKFGNISKIFPKSGGGKKNSYGLGSMLGTSVLFSTVFAAIGAVNDAIIEGSDNLTQYSASYNGAISSIVSSLTTLKNAWAVAFSPIIQVVTPYLTQFINAVSSALNSIGALTSALTGKSMSTAAVGVSQDYAKSLADTGDNADKAAGDVSNLADALSVLSFDELNQLSDNSAAQAPATEVAAPVAAEVSPSEMFTEVPIAESIKRFAERLKQSWEQADFYWLGALLAQKINNALSNIPWGEIQATAGKLGKSLATFLNGSFENIDFALIGHTIAEGLNTALSFLYSFADNFNFSAFGTAIADAINGLVSSINFQLFADTLQKWATGIAATINSLVKDIDWVGVAAAIGVGINSIISAIGTLITGIDWIALGQNLQIALMTLFQTIDFLQIGQVLGSAFMALPTLLLSIVSGLDFSLIGTQIGTLINGALSMIDLGTIGETISKVALGLLTMFTNAIQTIDWTAIGQQIVDFFGAIDWVGLGSQLFTAGVSLISGLLDVFGELPAPVQIAAAAVGGFFAAFKGISAISSITSGVSSLIGVLSGGLGPAISGVVSALGGPLTIGIATAVAAGALLIANWDEVTAAFKRFDEFLTNVFSVDWTEHFGLFGNVLNVFSNVIESFYESFKQVFGGIIDFVTGVFSADWSKALGGLKDIFTGVWNGIKEFTVGIPSEMLKLGINIVQGLIDGIESLAESAIDAVKDIGGNIIEGFKGLLGIHSPSTVFAEMGANTVQGYINGAEGESGNLSSSMSRIASNTTGSFTGIDTQFGAIGSNVVSSLNAGIVAGQEPLIEQLRTLITTMISTFEDTPEAFTAVGQSIVQGISSGINLAQGHVNVTLQVSGMTAANMFVSGFNSVNIAGILDNFLKEIEAGIAAMPKMFSKVFSEAANQIEEIFSGIDQWFNNKWRNIEKTYSVVPQFFRNVFKSGYNNVINAWNNVDRWFDTKWSRIKSTYNAVPSSFMSWFRSAYLNVMNIWTPINAWFAGKWTAIRNVFSPSVVNSFRNWFQLAYSNVQSIWNPSNSWFQLKWNQIKNVFSPSVADSFRNWFRLAYTNVQNIWNMSPVWFQGRWNGIKAVFSDVNSFFRSGFQTAYNSVTNIWSGLGDFFKRIAENAFSPIKKLVNGIIAGVNWVLKEVDSGTRLSSWGGVAFAKGSNGIPRDTLGVVNDQKGATYKELIVPPSGNAFIPNGRNVMLPLEKGTKIMPAKQTKKFMSSLGIPKFADGIGDLMGWRDRYTGDVFDYLGKPNTITRIALDKFTDISGIFGVWKDVASGMVNKVFSSVSDFVGDALEKAMPTVNYNPSAGVEQWRSLAAKALRMEGQYSPSNLNLMLFQMQTESSGNPNAINNWDINAKRGTPSKGLMQVIDPTFRAYARPGYNSNIWDPLSNMLASIRYTVRRYGSLARGWRGHGYAEGIGTITWSDLMGGIPFLAKGGLITSPTLAFTGENFRKEAVLPLENRRTMGMIADSIVSNSSGGLGLSKAEIQQAVADGVVMAMMNNQGNQPNITVYAELKTENDEVLARAVTRGQQKIDYRMNPVGT